MSTAETPLSDRLASYRTLRAGITPGPWTADLREPWDMVIWGAEGTDPEVGDPHNPKLVMNVGEPIARVGDVCGSEADARFIAAAPQIADDCLALAEENARLQADLARFRGDAERLDWLDRMLHDREAQSIGDVTLWGGWNHISLEVGLGLLKSEGHDVRHAIDAARASRTPDAARRASDGARHE